MMNSDVTNVLCACQIDMLGNTLTLTCIYAPRTLKKTLNVALGQEEQADITESLTP